MAIFAVGMLAVATMQTTAIQGNTLSSGLSQAVMTYNQDRVEQLLAIDYNDSALDAGAHGPETQNGYSTSWTVTPDTPYAGAKTIAVTTRWKDQSGSHSVTTSVIKDSRLD
jgi:Tfp pilus assembly protein PilV